jgi:outer membrane protein
MHYFKNLLMITAALTPLGAIADEAIADGHQWTYTDCVDWAKAHNVELRQSQLSALVSDEDVKTAKDAWLPTVSFGTNQSLTNYPWPGTNQKQNSYTSSYDINASWTVWEGNARKYQLEMAKLTRRQKDLAGDEITVNLETGILTAYLNIMYNHEAIEIAQKTLEVSTAQQERSLRLMESGRISKVDYAQIESQAAQDAYNLTQAETGYATAVVNLKKLLELGITYDLKVANVTFSDDLVFAALPAPETVYDNAMAWLPGFKSNDLDKEIAEAQVKSAKTGHLPKITLTGGVGAAYTSTGSMSWTEQMKRSFNEGISLNLSVPIFDGNSTKRAVAKAKLQEIESELNREQLNNNLSQTIENLFIEARNAQAKYVTGQKQLEATELTAQLVDRQFELGSVNPIDLLTAHNNLLNARLELLQSKYMAILSNKTIEYYSTQSVTIP